MGIIQCIRESALILITSKGYVLTSSFSIPNVRKRVAVVDNGRHQNAFKLSIKCFLSCENLDALS